MMKHPREAPRVSRATESASSNRLYLIMLAISAPVFAWLFVVIVTDLQQGWVSRNWPTVEGRVLSVKLDDEDYPPIAILSYRYEVDGTVYEGNAVDSYRFRYWGVSSRRAEAILQRYPVSTTVVVHYDPARPQTALLEPGASWEEAAAGLEFLGLTTLSTTLLIFWHREKAITHHEAAMPRVCWNS